MDRAKKGDNSKKRVKPDPKKKPTPKGQPDYPDWMTTAPKQGEKHTMQRKAKGGSKSRTTGVPLTGMEKVSGFNTRSRSADCLRVVTMTRRKRITNQHLLQTTPRKKEKTSPDGHGAFRGFWLG